MVQTVIWSGVVSRRSKCKAMGHEYLALEDCSGHRLEKGTFAFYYIPVHKAL